MKITEYLSLPSIKTSQGGWDSSDGRSSGSDIHQRRVGYERQMKREYNARHNNRMNRMKEESGMEVHLIIRSQHGCMTCSMSYIIYIILYILYVICFASLTSIPSFQYLLWVSFRYR